MQTSTRGQTAARTPREPSTRSANSQRIARSTIMRPRHCVTSILAALGVFATMGTASASSHREAPAISMDPSADNTDVWSWVSKDLSTLYVVAAYNPLEEPSGGPNFHKFSDDVMYEIHIARGDKSLEDVVTFQFNFTTSSINYVDPASQSAPPGG